MYETEEDSQFEIGSDFEGYIFVTITKMNNKYLLVIILGLLLLCGYLLIQTQKEKVIESVGQSAQEVKCFSWTTYDPSTKTWRWRAEHLSEYFPTKEDAVANCIAMLGGYNAE